MDAKEKKITVRENPQNSGKSFQIYYLALNLK